MKMRNFTVACASVALTTFVVANAYFQKKQFYPSVVFITKSNPSMAVVYVQCLVLLIMIGKLIRKIFFGELRPAEFEHLIERSWYAVTETCLAFTIFKDDFSPKFIALFAILLFIKSFHWLAEDRVDFMERSPAISVLFHIRIGLLLALLALADGYFVTLAYYWTLAKGASVHVVFGFEYAILLTAVMNISIKYILHGIDINREVFWEAKAVILLHVELVISFVKVVLYVLFVGLMVKLYTLPLFAIRPMYYSMRTFKRALHDVVMSRRAIRNMNTLYPDATPEELASTDNVCIICREEMHTASKKLPCNHIFHSSCLRSWFQRHHTCPTCRLNILRNPNDRRQRTEIDRLRQMGLPPLILRFFLPLNLRRRIDREEREPRQDIPQQEQQQFNQEQANAPGSSSTATGATSMAYPFIWAPLPFIPGVSTLPTPPESWNGMSTDQLRQMEESSRRGVEARLQCLRNINTLLDTSMLLMQQYTAAAAVAVATPPPDPDAPSSTRENANSQSAAPTDRTESSEQREHTNAANVENEPSTARNIPEEASEGGVEANSQRTADQEELRRRRLQRFADQ